MQQSTPAEWPTAGSGPSVFKIVTRRLHSGWRFLLTTLNQKGDPI